jgi:hypothetical protein
MVEYRSLTPPSSRGPGRSPFKAKTGVRISVEAHKPPQGGFSFNKTGFRCASEYSVEAHKPPQGGFSVIKSGIRCASEFSVEAHKPPQGGFSFNETGFRCASEFSAEAPKPSQCGFYIFPTTMINSPFRLPTLLSTSAAPPRSTTSEGNVRSRATVTNACLPNTLPTSSSSAFKR